MAVALSGNSAAALMIETLVQQILLEGLLPGKLFAGNTIRVCPKSEIVKKLHGGVVLKNVLRQDQFLPEEVDIISLTLTSFNA